MRSSPSLIVAILGAGGCGEALGPVAHLAPPDTGAARAAVLATIAVERVVDLRAYDLDRLAFAAEPIIIPPIDPPPDHLELLLFDLPLAELGLREGPVERQARAAGGGLLPDPDDVLVARAIDGASWVAQNDPSLATQRVEVTIAPPNPCVPFGLEEVPIPESHGLVTFAVAAGDGSALVGLTDHLARIWFDGRLETADLAIETTSTSTHVTTAFRAVDGELWLADPRGHVLRGSVEQGFRLVPGIEPLRGVTYARLDGTRTGTRADEIFYYRATTTSSLLERHAGGTWSVVARLAAENGPGEMIWIGPGEVLTFGHASGNGFLTHRGGAREERSVPFHTQAGGGLFAMDWIAGFGVVFRSAFGQLTFYRGGVFETHAAVFNNVADVAPLDDGILFGGYSDLYSQFHQGRFCEVAAFGSDIKRTEIVPFESGYLVPRRIYGAGPSAGIMRRK
ncbi:MAG: hypothetical protein IT384_01870 [Deltaproteobacteria bacterium]|nr:hypothetical protein [Deltaproteobacteria bacterium]